MQILKDVGLTVTVETKVSTSNEGTVLSQSKKEGTTVYKGDNITIVVAKKGTDKNPKPDVNEIVKPIENIIDSIQEHF